MSSIPIPSVASRKSPLTGRQLDQLRAELEQERRWLAGTAALRWLGTAAEPGTPRLQGRLRQVLEALERIENGTYGICVICRGDIEFERLEVIPETPTCVRCGRP